MEKYAFIVILLFIHYTNKNVLDDVYLHAVISSEKIKMVTIIT